MVVLRAKSSAKFLPDEVWELSIKVPELGLADLLVRMFTRWAVEAGQRLPRELVVEVRGWANSLDDALGKFPMVARPLVTMAGFVANVQVDEPEVHLAFDSTPMRSERGFVETYLPDESGVVGQGRVIHVPSLVAACLALRTMPRDGARLSRALRHYELALRRWYLGGEWLALNHLWIAAETLTKAVIRNAMATRRVSEQELAHEFGVVTDDPDRPRWKEILQARVREALVFNGDNNAYKTTKDASDGLEHGMWDLDKVATHANQVIDATFGHIRRTIVDLLAVPEDTATRLLATTPLDVQSLRKVIRGRLIGTAADPAPEGEMYPRLHWTTGIESAIDGRAVEMNHREQMTLLVHPDIGFQLDRIEVHGRPVDGQAPINLTDDGLVVSMTPASPALQLRRATALLIEESLANGLLPDRSIGHRFAFTLYGQAVAFFHSISKLIDFGHPIEALPVLRALVTLSARFKEMADPTGPGLGIAVRLALDSVDQHHPDVSLERQQEVLAAAAGFDLKVPEASTDPRSSTIYQRLRMEMLLADLTSVGAVQTAGMHLFDGHPTFRVQQPSGPLTDLVSSAAAIAALNVLRNAATVLEWPLDTDKLVALLDRAHSANEAAAQSDLSSSG
ncbi:hypothetical protein LV75_000462 [Actinokineospora diospyrosa]|uniref:Uncharacterized protein n=1 Tax=Actinokineospora diospyrosa TaxID=103728 RepID=A0ABT1I5T9_9PSEU|nr:hypothetical protein [Actinokineospora diospyrosa]